MEEAVDQSRCERVTAADTIDAPAVVLVTDEVGGAAAAAEQRGAEFTAGRDCGQDIVCVVGKDYADRDLAVVRTIGGVKRSAAVVESNVTAKVFWLAT